VHNIEYKKSFWVFSGCVGIHMSKKNFNSCKMGSFNVSSLSKKEHFMLNPIEVTSSLPNPSSLSSIGCSTDNRIRSGVTPVFGQLADLQHLVPLVEAHYSDKISSLTTQLEVQQETARKLVTLSRSLSAFARDHTKTAPLSPDVLALVRDLEKRGVQLLSPEELKVSPERVNDLKSQIASELDLIRSTSQIGFSQISSSTARVQAILDSLKMVFRGIERTSQNAIARQVVQ
jgi:hypothetical protein